MNTFTLPNGAVVFPELEQGTTEWLAARSGIPTASEFSTLLVAGKGPYGLGAGAITYACEKAGEILTGAPAENFSSPYADRGHALEPQVRAEYELITGADVREVGFIRFGRAGYSPDGLVGEDGLFECKTHAPKKLIGMLLDGEIPKEHRAQLLGGLLVSGRDWIELVGYWPGLPHVIRRLHRQDCEKEIAQLADAIERFNGFVDEIVARVRAYGGGEMAIAAE